MAYLLTPSDSLAYELPDEPPIVVEQDLSEVELCNCYAFVKSNIEDLPRMVDVLPNSDIQVGAVAIFEYSNGLKHVGIVREIWKNEFLIEETNYKKCTHKNRLVDMNDQALIGFWYNN